MQFKFLRIPTDDPGPATDELNGFLRSHRVVTVRSELVCLADAAFWAVSVEYLEGAPKAPERPVGKVDYREVLDEATFRVFSRLRDWRKAEAEKERMPVYTIFTNEQLAEMARRRVQSRDYFRIYDSKERQICAASFRERVLHHAVMNICEPVFERSLIHHTYAFRVVLAPSSRPCGSAAMTR